MRGPPDGAPGREPASEEKALLESHWGGKHLKLLACVEEHLDSVLAVPNVLVVHRKRLWTTTMSNAWTRS